MASIFTYDPDPPRVQSPWSTPPPVTMGSLISGKAVDHPRPLNNIRAGKTPTKLVAEPQEGPTEYKLHLLLRPRRSFVSISTGYNISGSHRSVSQSPKLHGFSETPITRSPSLQARSAHNRQQRLEQLTTQLLWRLQQSCPHHSSSFGNQITPSFPDASNLAVPPEIGRIVPGLEETRGALYEIGVADNGTLVGLAQDEMDESIRNLRAMAASLGCVVEVLRMVSVGDCEWLDSTSENLRAEKLWVAEAYVKPNTGPKRSASLGEQGTSLGEQGTASPPTLNGCTSTSEELQTQLSSQVKVSLTGATMSGKTSLLGSLTTTTLDNGRGKSRVSLLKHQHEIASGMTSSLTQELVGYNDASFVAGLSKDVNVVNYASGNISSWMDIHASCASGRLALLSDSAGHPRYRHTTVRGLIGWAPDWTLLCIPADKLEDTSGMTGSTPPPEKVFGISSVDVDLSQEHLELCLKLHLPLAVIVTKLDLASKAGLKSCLAQVLSTLKAAGRRPLILPNSVAESDLHSISAGGLASCAHLIEVVRVNPLGAVPIILTSAVKGTGISTLHALLYSLPIPTHNNHGSTDEDVPKTLFHIEDVYSARHGPDSEDSLPVLGGHLRYGHLNIGDELLLGPYVVDSHSDDSDSASADRPHIPTSRSFPGALHKAKGLPYVGSNEEWRRVTVISLRNLRLPVRTLFEGQAGTVGVKPVTSELTSPALTRIRKGMVLANGTPEAKRVFVAEFARQDVGGLSIRHGVVVYVASVRASAKVIAGAVPDDDHQDRSQTRSGEEGFDFSFEEDEGFRENVQRDAKLLVTFQFIASREYVEVGSQVLVMPGGGPGLYGGKERGEKGVGGFNGFVGRVVHS